MHPIELWKLHRNDFINRFRGSGDTVRILKVIKTKLTDYNPYKIPQNKMEYYVYRLEFGYIKGHPMYRIMCDNIEVEIGER